MTLCFLTLCALVGSEKVFKMAVGNVLIKRNNFGNVCHRERNLTTQCKLHPSSSTALNYTFNNPQNNALL